MEIRELTEATEKVEKNGKLFRALVEQNDSVTELTDKNLIPFFRTHSTGYLSGFTFEDRKGSTISDEIHPDDLEQVKIGTDKILNNPGEAFRLTFRVKHKGGYYIWVEATYKNLLNDPDIAAIVVNMKDVTQRQKTLEDLKESELKYRSLIEQATDAICVVDSSLTFIIVNTVACELLQYSRAELLKLTLKDLFFDEEDVSNAYIIDFLNLTATLRSEHRITRRDGTTIDIELSGARLSNGNIQFYAHDITERKRAENKIINLNRLYEFISQINEAIIRIKDKHTLFKDFCRIAVETGKFKMAWIGYPQPATHWIKPVATYGETDSYLSLYAKISANADLPEGRGLMGKVIREGHSHYCNDIQNATEMLPWREETAKRGYCSSASLPIKPFGKTEAAFTLYAPTTNFFNDEEVQLLDQIAINISFALESFEKEALRKTAEASLLESEKKYRYLFEANPLPSWVVDNSSDSFFAVNKAAVKHYGYSQVEFLSMKVKDIQSKSYVKRYLNLINNPETNFNGHLGFWKHRRKNGNIIDVELVAHEITYENRPARLVLVRDITEKLKADLEIKKINNELRTLSSHLQNVREQERIQIARDIHDELGQQLTGLKMDVYSLSKKIKEPDEIIKQKILDISDLLDDAVVSVRKIAANLRPSVLDDLGLIAALEWQSKEVEKRFGIKVNFSADREHIKLNADIATNLFRIYQEALTNAVRHANAHLITGKLKVLKKNIVLEIKDDGKGIDRTKKKPFSFGILGIKERVFVMGGDYDFKSQVNKGTYLSVSVPFSN